MDNEKKVTKDFLMEHADDSIGQTVYTCEDSDFKDYARKAATICRRRFKAADAVVMTLLDMEEEGNAGIVFTEKALYYWEEDDNFICEVVYADIKTVDYDSNGVKVTLRSVPAETHVDDEEPVAYITNMILKGAAQAKNVVVLPATCYDWNLDEEEEKDYIRGMYNFIADIVDEVNEGND